MSIGSNKVKAIVVDSIFIECWFKDYSSISNTILINKKKSQCEYLELTVLMMERSVACLRTPLDGKRVMIKVMDAESGSVAVSVMGTGVSSRVVVLLLVTTGGSLTALTKKLTVTHDEFKLLVKAWKLK